MPDDVREESAYKAIEAIVESAHQMEEEGKYQKAKIAYLDGAESALEVAKTHPNYQETYQQIAKMLVDRAKEVKILHEMEDSPLPVVPLREENTENKTSSSPAVENIRVGEDISQIMVINEGGTPIINYISEDFDGGITSGDEILFSGAISAISQLVNEIMQKEVHTINFESGYIMIKAKEDLRCVFVSQLGTPTLEGILIKFSDQIVDLLKTEFTEQMRMSQDLSNHQDVVELVHKTLNYHVKST